MINPTCSLFSKLSPRFCDEPIKIGHKFTKQSWSKVNEIKDDCNESCFSYLLFLIENHFQEECVNNSEF